MRAYQGQSSDNVAIHRTVQQKELLVRELEETLSATKIKSLRAQLSARVRELRVEIREDQRAEAEKAQAASVRAALRQADNQRRPRREHLAAPTASSVFASRS